MNISYVAIIAWIPVSAGLFALFRPVVALVLAYLIGWLALPMVPVEIRGFWDIDKIMATNAGVLLGSALFCPGKLRGYQVGAADIALLAYATGTCLSSITNDLGVYDGVSSLMQNLFRYAVPYAFGRAFVKDRGDLYRASRLIVYGAAVYALFAVWEWRMSPQIHRTLYGFFQHSFWQHVRWGFYRPVVCFPHALGLGWFFAWTSLLGIWLLRAGKLRPLLGFPPVVIAMLPPLGLLTSMSLGPWGLFVFGLGILVCWSRTRSRRFLWVPVVFALFWMAGRYTGLADGRWLTSAVAKASTERAASLQYRVDAETLLLDRAKERPFFGWGGWGRNQVRDERGRNKVAQDGLWLIFVGCSGLVGLSFFYLWWCWPVLLSGRVDASLERDPVLMVLLVAVGLQAANFLFNGFLSPVLTLMSGAVVTALLEMIRRARRAGTPAHVYAEPGHLTRPSAEPHRP